MGEYGVHLIASHNNFLLVLNRASAEYLDALLGPQSTMSVTFQPHKQGHKHLHLKVCSIAPFRLANEQYSVRCRARFLNP